MRPSWAFSTLAAAALVAGLAVAEPAPAPADPAAPADPVVPVAPAAPVAAADPVALAAQLARGDLLLRRGQPAEAAAVLQAVASADWPLRGLARLVLGQAQLAAGRPEDALASAEAAAPGGVHAPEVAWLRASALDALGRPEAADALLALAAEDSSLDAQRTGQALVRAARLLEASRPADAARAWRRAAFEAPAQAPADALSRAEALSAAAGAPLPGITTAQRLDLARALRAANLHERAVAAYLRAEKGLAGGSLVSAKLSRARSHFDLRQNDEARAACAEVVRLSPGTEAAADCRLISARAAWRDDEGAAVLAQVRAGLDDPRLRRADARADLRLVEGNYYLERGRLDDAVRAFAALLAESPGGSKAGEARWRIAWCRLQQGRPADAATEFDRLAKEQAGGELERIGALWSAISRERAGVHATAAFADVARRWPWTYQGEQARQALAARLEPAALASAEAEWRASGIAFTPPGKPDLAGDAGLRYALLRDAGLPAWALPEIQSLQPARGKSDAFAFELAKARARAGKASQAEALLRSRFSRPLQQPSRLSPPDFWEVVYPLPRPELVAEASARHGIDAALCAAIIRSESGWDPSARSWADARGLMQLVPATAAKLARAEGLADFDAGLLFDPAVNVALGARHLGALLTLFQGDLDAALASYNAGEDKVAAWWAGFDRDGVGAAERVERIPYRETRQYVRRVRDAMGWYAWLLDAEAPEPLAEVPAPPARAPEPLAEAPAP